MSIFTRPDSPPPRQPSPDFVPAPLPSPHLQARLRKSSSKQSLLKSSPSLPPGLHLFPGPRNFVHTTRSYEHLDERADRRRTSSNPASTAPPSWSQLTVPSTSLSVDHNRPSRRSVHQAARYRSPPPSPAIASPPPPVPRIPAFVLTSPQQVKPTHPPQSGSIDPIHLPDFNVSPLSESTFLPRQHHKMPPPQKHSGLGMTCLKFFSLRNTKQKVPYRPNP